MPSPRTKPYGILIVDDDKTYRQALQTALTSDGYSSVWAASNAKEAFHCLDVHGRDIVLLIVDYRLGETTGVSLVSRLASSHVFPTNVIFVTAFSLEDMRSEIAMNGLDHFDLMVKPLKGADIDHFLQLIELQCIKAERRRMEQAQIPVTAIQDALKRLQQTAEELGAKNDAMLSRIEAVNETLKTVPKKQNIASKIGDSIMISVVVGLLVVLATNMKGASAQNWLSEFMFGQQAATRQ